MKILANKKKGWRLRNLLSTINFLNIMQIAGCISMEFLDTHIRMPKKKLIRFI